MTLVLIKHKVKDFSAWKTEFDKFADFRRKGGEKAFRLLHPTGDQNDLTLLFDWDSRENAEKFMASSELKDAMGRAGVAEEPRIEFLNEVDKGSF